MANTSIPDLVKVTEIFLIPSSFLVAALGTADTNFHRAAVSLVGLIVSALWQVCSHEALGEHLPTDAGDAALQRPVRLRILYWLPAIFIVGWLISVITHLILWDRPLGH